MKRIIDNNFSLKSKDNNKGKQQTANSNIIEFGNKGFQEIILSPMFYH